MITVTKKQYAKISNDYKDKWDKIDVEQCHLPQKYVGKRAVLSGCIKEGSGCVLLTEGLHFKIVD